MVSGAKNGGYRGVFERKGQRLPSDSRELTVSSVRGGVKVDGADGSGIAAVAVFAFMTA